MRLRHSLAASAFLLLLCGCAAHASGPVVWLDSLDMDTMTQDFGNPHAKASVDGNPITLSSKVYDHGVGTHANSVYRVRLAGRAERFEATVGVDDETKGRGSVTFSVLVDGKTAAQTGILHGGDAPQRLSVPLAGAQSLTLLVNVANGSLSFDHGDWADAAITLAGGATALPAPPVHPHTVDAAARLRLIPPDPHPAIHGPRLIGATPGKPFLFLIPATGDGPLTFGAKLLPAGLRLDAHTGIISGALAKAGTTQALLTVHGPHGTATRAFTIVGGAHKLALTPPLGWNSWNVWADHVDAGKVKDAADEMIAAGLARHGFQYVNIDDTWEQGRSGDTGRDAEGNVLTNDKFPDMPALAAYIHSKGLKVGIYSSPGPTTCGGYTASYQHEAQDAATYAKWGMDYLKYDWCSYDEVVQGNHSLPVLQRPYDVMGADLAAQPRDIVFSLCQYGWGDVWKWGATTGGSSWRTTGDIEDNWGSMHAIYESQAGHEAYAGPGHWNDPDMLMVGIVGKGNVHPTHLTPNEQVLHISMWCLLSSPLLIGCDMTKLDPLTLALLTNDEALDINQDPLGKPAALVSKDAGDGGEAWARPLFDGTHAVGLVNPNPWVSTLTVQWADLGLKGPQPVRDLWLHQNVGIRQGHYSVEVPAHGCVLLKVGRPAAVRSANYKALTSGQPLLSPPQVPAVGAGDADTMVKGYNNAFLVTSGTSAYYKKSLSDSKPDDTWVAALDIMGEEDVYDHTGSAADKTLVNNLCATWLQNTPPGSADKPWSWDGWNDDLGWFTMALARGYRITGNTDFLTQAENGFNYAFSRGWDTKWNGGGIWEQQIEYCKNGAKVSKETLSNDSLGIVACLLYQSTHKAVYLDDAKQIYDWEWNHLYDSATGQVYTGVTQDGTVDKGTAVYNQGSFVYYANFLYQITGNAAYLKDAKSAIDFTKSNLTTGGVIGNSAGWMNAWADMFARGLGHFVRDNHQWATYYPWMVQNANAIMSSRRTDDNITWNGWAEQTPTDNTLITSKCVSAVAWLEYTPVTQPNAITGNHVIVSKQNGIAIDNGGGFTTSSSTPAGIVERSLNYGQNQKWSFTQNADNSWNIVSESSWQALDDPAGSTTSGTKIIQWPLNREANQRWWVARQPNGSYKISNQASGLVLDSSGSAVNGHPLVQRVWNGKPQQLWLLK